LSNYGCSRVFIHLSNHSFPLTPHLQTLTTCLRACRIVLFEMIVEHCIWTIQGLKGSVRAVPGPGFLLQGVRSGPGWFWGLGLLEGADEMRLGSRCCWPWLFIWFHGSPHSPPSSRTRMPMHSILAWLHCQCFS